MNVTYDDRDSVFKYSPGWFLTGTYNATSVGQTGTLASSDITSGVNVTFVFPAPATEFFYFGIKRCCGAAYLICVDCDPNDRQFVPINAVDPTDDGQNPPVVLYSQKFSVAGVHEVILMNQPDLAFGGKSQITLDRFELTVPDPGAATASSTLLSSPSSTPTTNVGALAKSSSSTTSRYLAPILGGILGGLATLLLVIVIWLLVRRRSRRPVYNEEQASSDNQAQSLWRSPSTLTTLTAPTTISARTSRRELDAGRIDNYPEPDEVLPPEYGQVFNTDRRAPSSVSSSSQSETTQQFHVVTKAMR
jgi:hypothetical protein